MINKIKEFGPSSWSIDNKTSIYILTIIITLAGLMSYNALPKEQFPEIVFPQLMVNTIYPGTSPTDMENIVTKHIEKQVKSISGVKKINSNSIQDFSMINIEFNTNVDVAVAKQKVKDAVDKAKTDLPKDLPSPPDVIEIDVSQIPIMNIHISGDYGVDRLKKYADLMQEKIEGMTEITRVDIVGALTREVQVDVDMYRMSAANISFGDVERAIAYENMTISGGAVDIGNVKRNINVVGQFTDPRQLENIVIRGASGATVFLRDIATIVNGYKDQESYARLDGKNVITLNVIKRSGENLIIASDKIRDLATKMEKEDFPSGLKVTITGDQSTTTRTTLHDLINTIIIGFILVTLILMFFMGATNAIFVGLSVPISMCIAFLIMPSLGFTLNMIVLFSFLLALGIVVDDAIVVIENTHRIFNNGKVPIKQAAKYACGEVFLPVFSGTMTTLAPFIPLAFWQGVIGKFMFFLPITLIVTLLASLVVAYIINPVFAVDFMKPHDENEGKGKITKGFKITTVVFLAIAILFYIGGSFGMGNFTIFIYLMYLLHHFVLERAIQGFQRVVWPKFQDLYARMMTILLKGYRPIGLLVGTVVLFFFTLILTGKFAPNVVFFPQAEPNFIFAYITLPVGTNQNYTDSITQIVEGRVQKVLGKDNPVVNSIIANVAVGANDPRSMDLSSSSHLGKVTVAFVEYGKRNGVSTADYLDQIRDAVKGIPGTQIIVEQEKGGPPTGKPISIEISGDKFDDLTKTSQKLLTFLNKKQIPGVEELKSDLVASKPQILVSVDRERANREGIATAQIGMEIRTAVFGKEVSKFKEDNDEVPIMLRYQRDQRNNVNILMNTSIAYRDMVMMGQLRQVPLSSIATVSFDNTFGGIKRKNSKRMVTISSNVLNGFNPNEVVTSVQQAVEGYSIPEGITINMAGEQEEQKETGTFLGNAMLVSLGLIFLILVTQFNSLSKPLIIISEILFSIIGVLLGFIIFRMDISIVMTGIGVVALAGIVVRNGILLVEFTDILLEEGYELKDAIIEAGKTRMTPVILTATATISGLIPLAIGLNMDFVKLFTEFNPHIYFGGDSVAFWGPLSWTMIFGLAFATVLTLVLVPAMLLISESLKRKFKPKKVEEEPVDVEIAI